MLKKPGIFFLLSVVMTSCGDTGVVFQETKEIKEAKWDKDAPVSFDFSISDTTQFHDFYLDLRTTTSYEWSNLYVFVEIDFPNGKNNIDTVEFILADKTGKWNGKKSGSLVDNNLLFIHNKRLPLKGDYSMKFTQAMRQDVLEEVTDVGLIIKETKKP